MNSIWIIYNHEGPKLEWGYFQTRVHAENYIRSIAALPYRVHVLEVKPGMIPARYYKGGPWMEKEERSQLQVLRNSDTDGEYHEQY